MSLASWDWLYNAADKFETWFNIFEAVFWIAVGAGFLRMILKVASKNIKIWTLATLTLVFFGFSDFVEAQTGAWWRPWWLLMWKGLCLLGLVALYVWHKRPARQGACVVAHEAAK